MPQRPDTGNVRSKLAERAGPPTGPKASRVSITRQGVTVWKASAQVAVIGLVRAALAVQPFAFVTMTFTVTEPEEPAVKVMAGVPAPAVMVPFVIAQE